MGRAGGKGNTSSGDSADENVGKADQEFVRLSNEDAGEGFVGQMFTKAFATYGTSSLWVGEITGYDAARDEFTVLYIADRTEVPTSREEVRALAAEGGPHHKYLAWSGDQHEVQRAERSLPFPFRKSNLCSSMEVGDVVEVVMEANLRVREMVYRGEVVRRQRIRTMTHLTVRWYREDVRCHSVLHDGKAPIRMVADDDLTLEEQTRIHVTRKRGGKKKGTKKVGTKKVGARGGAKKGMRSASSASPSPSSSSASSALPSFSRPHHSVDDGSYNKGGGGGGGSGGGSDGDEEGGGGSGSDGERSEGGGDKEGGGGSGSDSDSCSSSCSSAGDNGDIWGGGGHRFVRKRAKPAKLTAAQERALVRTHLNNLSIPPVLLAPLLKMVNGDGGARAAINALLLEEEGGGDEEDDEDSEGKGDDDEGGLWGEARATASSGGDTSSSEGGGGGEGEEGGEGKVGGGSGGGAGGLGGLGAGVRARLLENIEENVRRRSFTIHDPDGVHQHVMDGHDVDRLYITCNSDVLRLKGSGICVNQGLKRRYDGPGENIITTGYVLGNGGVIWIENPSEAEREDIRARIADSTQTQRMVYVGVSRDGSQLFESTTAPMDTEVFLTLFPADQVYFVQWIGQKWYEGDSTYEWLCQLEGTSARWTMIDVAVRYQTTVGARGGIGDGDGDGGGDNGGDGDGDGDGDRGGGGGGGDDGGGGGGSDGGSGGGGQDGGGGENLVLGIGLSEFGRSKRMNVTQHITNPWMSGWMAWRNNGAKDPHRRVALGLRDALVGWGSDADLDLQSLRATGMVPVSGSTYSSSAYGVRAFRYSMDTRSKKYYRMLTRRMTMTRGELLGHMVVFEELLAFLRSTGHLHGWRFEVKFRSSVVGGHPIEPRWLKVAALHVASAGLHLMRTGRVITHVEPQPVWLDRCEDMLCNVMYEAAVMRGREKAGQRVLLQVCYAADPFYVLAICSH